MRNRIVIFAMLALVVATAAAQDITVAAAADLNFALKEIASRYEQKTGHRVTLSFGSSGNLFSQIKNGAPYDVFFSADTQYAEQLLSGGFADRDSLRTYAIGHLVLWVPNSSTLDPQTLKLDVLTSPEVKRIAIANPQHAPYGRAAIAALEHAGLKDKLAGKLIYGENISQAAQFVQSGNAQAGLIALSLALSPPMKNGGKYWELPLNSYPELRQAAVIITASKRKPQAKAFLDYVTSSEGRVVLGQYGFRAPGGQ